MHARSGRAARTWRSGFMIVCHCNVIHCHEIRRSVAEMRGRDAHCVVTPGIVFKNCGKRPNCGNCMPLFAAVLSEAVIQHGGHKPPKVKTRIMDASSFSGLEIAGKLDTSSSVVDGSVYRTRSNNQNNEDVSNEGTHQSHRSAQQGAAS